MKSRLICLFLFTLSLCGRAQHNLRIWHTSGQTFLVWRHSVQVSENGTYDIFRSNSPITTPGQAEWAGRVFAGNGSNRRIEDVLPGSRWNLPDGAGGTVEVGEDEAYFVYTPRESGLSYYAVIYSTSSILDTSNMKGPVEESMDPVTCHIQHEGLLLTVYGHWIDGRAHHTGGRDTYPVMGNQYTNGMGFNFAVWNPLIMGAGDKPLVCAIHGGYGNLMWLAALGVVMIPGGLLATFDDPVRSYVAVVDSFFDMNTFWLGYHQSYNRFEPNFPSAADTIIDYTARRLLWEIGWIRDHWPVDTNRISISGASMGGIGTVHHIMRSPDLFSGGMAYVPLLGGLDDLIDQYRVYTIYGTPGQNLPVSTEGHTPIYDLLDIGWQANQPHPDWPFVMHISGKQDERIDWPDNLEVYRELDRNRTGHWLYWDEREHIDWTGAAFLNSEHLSFQFLMTMRKDRSFPAFSGTDVWPDSAGRQPDPGNGDPFSGDPFGSWGGTLEWDPESVEESEQAWSCDLWVVGESACPADIPESATVAADITPRRCKRFLPQAGVSCEWTLTRSSSGEILASGDVMPDDGGVVTIKNVLLIKEKCTLKIISPQTAVQDGKFGSPVVRSSRLEQNYPNPFNNETSLTFSLSHAGQTTLTVVDLQGREVITLVDGHLASGSYRIGWNGADRFHKAAASGSYFSLLFIDGVLFDYRKITLLR